MQKLVRCTRVLLSLTLLFGMFAAPAQAAFIDILPNHPLYDAVTDLQTDHVISGFDDGTFRPERLVTRGELIKIVVTAFHQDYDGRDCLDQHSQDTDRGLLSDVSWEQWEAPYVCIAKERGMIKGYSDHTFRSEQPVSFAEVSKILSRAAGLIDTYHETGENWYERYVHELDSQQAIPLTIDDFEQPLNRGEVAEMIYRLKNHITTKDSQIFSSLGSQPIFYYYLALGRPEYEGTEINNQQQSYDLLLHPGDSLSSFFEQNHNIRWAQPTAFQKIGDHIYQFHLQVVQSDMTEKRYIASMEVRGGKVRLLSSTEIEKELVETVPFDSNTAAEVEWEKGNQTLFIRQGQDRKPIDRIAGFGKISWETYPKDFSEIHFSPKGSYISYYIGEWEGGTAKVYDISRNTPVYQNTSGAANGFSNDEKKFYACQNNYDPVQISIYDLPSFDLRRELIDTSKDIDVNFCSYNKSKNSLDYTVLKSIPQGAQWPRIFEKYDMSKDSVTTSTTDIYDDGALSLYYPTGYAMKQIGWWEVALYRLDDPGNSSIHIRQVPREELDKYMPLNDNQRIVSLSDQYYAVFIFTNIDQNPWFEQIVNSVGYSIRN